MASTFQGSVVSPPTADAFRQEILDLLPDRVFWKDAAGRYLGCNLAFARDAGVGEPAAILGLTDADLAWRAVSAEMAADDRRVLEGQSLALSVDRRLEIATGGKMHALFSVSPLRDAAGAVVGIFGRYRDLAVEQAREGALAEARQWADLAFSTNRVGLWEWQVDEQTLATNSTWWRMLGEAPRDGRVPDSAYFERIHPEDREHVESSVRHFLGGQDETLDFAVRMRCADGSHRWIRTVGRRFGQPERGAALRVIGQNIDVDDARRRESALQEVTAALDAASDQIFIFDSSSLRHVYVNHGACTATGYTAEQLIGMTPMDLVVGLQEAATREQCARLVRDGAHVMYKVSVRRRDGSTYPAEAALRHVPGQGRILVVLRDISAWRSREQALVEMRAAMDCAGDAIFVRDIASDRIVYTNRVASELLGYSAEQLAEMRPFAFDRSITVEQLRAIRADLERDDERGVVVESVFETADGRDVPVSVSIRRVPEAGSSGRVITVARDITSQKLREIVLKRAQLQAESANRAKSDFLANMSHEIRTPLNGVIGMLDLLGGTPLDEEQSGFVHTARNSAGALLGLLNDILDLSRIEAGQLHIDDIEFDLHALVQDLARSMAPRAQEKTLELVCDVGPQLPRTLRGDPGRVRQVLTNLLGNALKFTQAGEVVLSVSLVGHEEDRPCLRFAVRDTGIGIAAEHQARLFKSFSQADSSVTRHYGGSGLGLAISKQLCELMGGAIGVSSVPGQGSTFWFELAFAVPVGRAPVPIADLRGAHVLVVDDNLSQREVLAAYLRVWGVRAETAGCADAALDYLRFAAAAGEPVQLAIIDLEMPGGDGLKLGSAIRALELPRQPALVLTSSSARRGDAQAAREAGFSAYLPKPTHADDLHACLCQALGRQRQDTGPQPLITRHSLRERRASGAHLLVVEDNVVNQEVARGMLARLGYGVDIAAHGRAALEALATHDYALVLMDCQMPEMDGYAASRAIRAGEGGVLDRGLPIIAMTAHAEATDRERCLAAGMSDFITKPVDVASLGALLAKWLPDALPAPQAAAGGDRDPVLDVDALRVRLGQDEALLAAVLASFLRDMPPRLAQLETAVAHGDLDEVRRLAHQLKGVAANVGALSLAAQAARLDEVAGSSPAPALGASVEAVLRAYATLRHRLDQLIASGALPHPGPLQSANGSPA